MKERPFLQLHTHSNIGSVRDCTASVDSMFKICSENKMGFAITDHGYAAAFAQINKKSKQYGVKPVYGVEFYLSIQRDRLFEIRKLLEKLKNMKPQTKDEKENIDDEIRNLNYEFEEIKKYNHICIIAKNIHGYKNIIELHNIATLNGFYGKPLASLSDILSMQKDKNGDRGVIITSACLSGVIPRNILNKKLHHAEEHAGIMKEEFRDNWYLEVQPHELEEQRIVNKEIIRISNKLSIPMVVGTDSHYISKEFSKSHEIFLLLQGEQKVEDIGKKICRITYETRRGETKRKKIDEGENFFGFLPSQLKEGDLISKKKVLDNSKWDFKIKKIEEINKVWMIEGSDLSFKTEKQLRQHLQSFEELLPFCDSLIETNKDVYEKIENFEWDHDLKLPIIKGANQKLFDLCVESLKLKGLYSNKEYIERFKTEFSVIKSGGLSSYFLILLDIIDFAKSRNIPVGPARGSSGASLIVYLLGITRIDPIRWGFNFERFLNPKKVSTDSERVRITINGKDIDYKPNDEITLKNGVIKKAKDLQIGDEI